MHRFKPKSLVGWMIVLPMAVVALYYALFAADRYVSESIITVQQAGQSAGAVSGLAALAGIQPQGREDVLYLKEYIASRDMLQHLDSKLGLRKAWGDAGMDVIYRLPEAASREWFHWYFRNRVELIHDQSSSLLKVRVEGFTPEFARAVNAEILAQSERFINEISHKIAREQLSFADSELHKSRERYQQAKQRLTQFQNQHRLLDPMAQAQATASLAGQLEADLARLEAELKNQLSYLQEDSHQVVALKSQITALRAQLEQERGRMTGGSGARLNTLASQFQGLALDAGFAEDAYKLALAATENTRIEASRKIKGLVVVESPTTPEWAVYPQRVYNLLTLLLFLTLLYGITRLALATLRDHQE